MTDRRDDDHHPSPLQPELERQLANQRRRLLARLFGPEQRRPKPKTQSSS